MNTRTGSNSTEPWKCDATRRHTISGAAIAIAVLLSAGGARPARAGQPEAQVPCLEDADSSERQPVSIAYSESTVGCVVSPQTDVDRFEFDGEEGEQVRIIVYARGDRMDPRLEIRDPVGNKLHDGQCTDYCSMAVQPSGFNLDPAENGLPMTGTYTLYLSDAGSDESGGYAIEVERIPPIDAAPLLDYGVPMSESLDRATDVDFLTFEGAGGDDVRIIVQARSDRADPVLEIWDPEMTPLSRKGCTDYCSLASETATFTLEPSESLLHDGLYTLALSDAGYDESGHVEVAVHCLRGGCDPTPPVELTYDSMAEEVIDATTAMRFFTFEGIEGTEIRLLVTARRDRMDPHVEVWDPDGVKLVDTWCADYCNVVLMSEQLSSDGEPLLEKSGTYRVAVSDAGYDEAGAFEIAVHCIDGACTTPPTPLVYDAPHGDAFEHWTNYDVYEFHGTAGSQIRLALSARGDRMDPHIQLLDPNGDEILNTWCSDYCSLSREFALENALELTGTYRLIVDDKGFEETGAYEIALHCLDGLCDSEGSGELDPPLPNLVHETTRAGRIDSATDADFVTFYGAANSEIRINIWAQSDRMDPQVAVWAPDGSRIVYNLWCGDYCSTQLDLRLEQSGFHLLEISDRGFDESGRYQVGIACLFGDCCDANIQVDSTDDGIPDVCECSYLADAAPVHDGDATRDGRTDGADYTIWADHHEQMELRFESGDLNCNGVVDGADYTVWADDYGSEMATDEPSKADVSAGNDGGGGSGVGGGGSSAEDRQSANAETTPRCGLGFEGALAGLLIASRRFREGR